MRWEQVSAQEPRAIGSTGHEDYARDGYLSFPGLIHDSSLAPLRSALSEIVESSRDLSESSHFLQLEQGHSAGHPRIRRAACVDDVAPVFWDFCSSSVLVDIAADILGENVRFREAFVNLKWSGGGAAVDWHQDLAFYPHTNSGTCQFIVALEEITPERGPLTLVAGSHRGELYSHYDLERTWTGAIDQSYLSDIDLDSAIEITGPAGTVSVHHGLMLHYSAPNHSDTSRPALVATYTAADSIPYTAPPYRSSHYGQLVRGIEPGVAHHEEMLLILPPDWTNGYTSIFDHQDGS